MSSAPLQPINPATGAALPPVARTPRLGSDGIGGIVARAREAQREWSERSVEDRLAALAGLERLFTDEVTVESLARTITEEMGKTLREARSEVRSVAGRLRGFATRAVEAAGDELAQEGAIAMRTRWCPLGVVGVIAPWNYPVATPSNLILSALLTGNAVVFKPSEQTPATGARLHQLLASLLPPDLIGLVQGAGDEGAALVASGLQMIAFTGSIATGKAIMRGAAEGLQRLVLELGGKDPMIVLPGADVAAAAAHAVSLGLANAGQACISVERILIHQSLADEFCERVVAAVREVRVGDPRSDSTTMGPMASHRQREHVVGQLADAKAKGAKVLVDGLAHDPGFFLAPSVLDRVTPAMAVAREETFGPVLAIARVADAEEAISLANDSPYGLGAGIWGEAGAALDALAGRLEAGMIGINRGLSAAAGAPWVGWKSSGFGYSRSVAGMRQFMQPQSWASDADV